MKQLRILMVVRLYYPWVGGAERQAQKLAQKLLERNVDVKIVTGWWYKGTPQCEVINGVPVFRNRTLHKIFSVKGLRKFGGYVYIITLWWHLWRQRDNYDVIHGHSLNYHTFPLVLAGRRFKRKTVTKLANSGRDSDIKRMTRTGNLPLAQYMLPVALKCDRFIAINETIITELIAAGVQAEKIIKLPNGVETNLIPMKSNYILNNPAQLIYVGRLHKMKGISVLLMAVQKIVKQHPDINIRLQLLGDGPQKNELQQMAKQLKISSLVEFVGQTDQVLKYLQLADIFVLPSRAEGISNALLEAMSSGLPAVVSEIPGNIEVIQHQQNGLLFTVDNASELADRLVDLLTNQPLREKFGQAGRKTVETYYNIEIIADKYIQLYQRLMKF